MFLKPKVKTSYPILTNDQGDICIGQVAGSTFIVKAPPRWLFELLTLLDGEHTLEEITQCVSAKYKGTKMKPILQVIKQLRKLGCLEEGEKKETILSTCEMILYDRQMPSFTLYEKEGKPGIFYQEKLKNQKVVIFGAGGWGSWLAINLALMGFGHITIVDGDKVDLSNLNRQILYTHDDIGSLKVQAAKKNLEKINPYVKIEIVDEYIKNDEKKIKRILGNITMIFIAWTNSSYFIENSVEKIIHKIAFIKKIPVIEVAANPLEIAVGPIFINNKSAPCYECSRETIKKRFYSKDNLIKSFQEAKFKKKNFSKLNQLNSWQNSISISTMAGIAVDQAAKVAMGIKNNLLIGKKLHLSLSSFKINIEKYYCRSDCEWCSVKNTSVEKNA